jgi:hypothetical protein
MKQLFFTIFLALLIPAGAIMGQNEKIRLDNESINKLYKFAFDCIDREYPNKPGGVLGDDSYLSPPRIIHPAFYGCFDWHSSVHGHWALVTILKESPQFPGAPAIIAKLKKNITKENILKEVEYLKDPNNTDFERTYGWAWLLKLDEALREWNNTAAPALHEALLPLVNLISDRYKEFLGKLNYPIRVGEHTNTAFGLSFAYDYAAKYDKELADVIKNKAIILFQGDKNSPLTWEPGAFDFLSPSLQEASLMMKIMERKRFEKWFSSFMPGFEKAPEKFLKVAVVSDRSDGKLAHLDGLNFSRAWCLYEMGHMLKNSKMIKLADEHLHYSYTRMESGEYAGAHWLASFALYALTKSE